MWFGPEKIFKHNTITVTDTGVYLFFHFLLTFALPPIFFYCRWIYRSFKKGKHFPVYFTSGLFILFIAFLGYDSISSKIRHRISIGADLGIHIPYWGTSFDQYDYDISWDRGEGDIKAEINLDQERVTELKKQIHQSKFFAYRKEELLGADMTRWSKSDTVHYWDIRKHLEKNKLTGLWLYDKQKQLYEFYEPRLSDIPNASILFKQDYTISAILNDKTRVLKYTRSQF